MLDSIQKKMLEVLEDTKQFYTQNPEKRAYDPLNGRCFYYCSKGNMCAVGRYLKDPEEAQRKAYALRDDGSIGVARLIRYINPEFKEGYEDLPSLFWTDIQKLHDNSYFYNKVNKSYTEEGEDYYNILLRRVLTQNPYI